MNGQQKAEAAVQAQVPAGLRHSTTAKQALAGCSLSGQVAIVTGGYSGIGLETVRALARAGATVIVPARSPEKAAAAVRGIPRVELAPLDLMDPSSIDGFADRFLASGRPLHILINSAGIMASPLMRDKRGYEAQFATNHLGHFQLTARLWPALKQARGARVVAVSSRAHRLGGVQLADPNFEINGYDKWKAYAQSKSANILFAQELDRLGQSYGVRAFSVHPGLIPSTGIGRFGASGKSAVSREMNHLALFAMNKLQLVKLMNLFKKEQAEKFKTIPQGAATSVWCAVSPALNGMGGVYCEDCNFAVSVPADSTLGYGVRPWATDPELARRLWKLSEELTGASFAW